MEAGALIALLLSGLLTACRGPIRPALRTRGWALARTAQPLGLVLLPVLLAMGLGAPPLDLRLVPGRSRSLEQVGGQFRPLGAGGTERLDLGSLQAVRPLAVRFLDASEAQDWRPGSTDCQAGLVAGLPPPRRPWRPNGSMPSAR